MVTIAKNAVIIVAAGRGERAGLAGGPKQYRTIGQQTVLARAVAAFTGHRNIDLVLVVIHADDREIYESSVSSHAKLLAPTIGGASRQQSVLNGLQALGQLAQGKVGKVMIHDAARPFVEAELITRVLDATGQQMATLPVMAITDTIKLGENALVEKTLPRDNLFTAQTPQGFDFAAILQAHLDAARQPDTTFTDDASIAEWAGIQVAMVKGSPANRKLTTAEDITMADSEMQQQIPDVRTGNGYDVHVFEAGNSVRLCGVDIAHTARLKGHSDADVGLHCLTDALLGTVASGDIGSHFPPSEDQWKDANSEVFFRHAVELVKQAGGQITHLDATIICEAPKIGPHRDKMRREISRMSGIPVDRISVKATTNERIGAIGRGEGIAGIATATVVFINQD